MQQSCRQVYVQQSLLEYMVALVQATRDPAKVLMGASPAEPCTFAGIAGVCMDTGQGLCCTGGYKGARGAGFSAPHCAVEGRYGQRQQTRICCTSAFADGCAKRRLAAADRSLEKEIEESKE